MLPLRWRDTRDRDSRARTTSCARSSRAWRVYRRDLRALIGISYRASREKRGGGGREGFSLRELSTERWAAPGGLRMRIDCSPRFPRMCETRLVLILDSRSIGWITLLDHAGSAGELSPLMRALIAERLLAISSDGVFRPRLKERRRCHGINRGARFGSHSLVLINQSGHIVFFPPSRTFSRSLDSPGFCHLESMHLVVREKPWIVNTYTACLHLLSRNSFESPVLAVSDSERT